MLLKKLYFVLLILLISLVLVACGATQPESADEPATAGEAAEASDEPAIMVMEPFARASIPNGAAYMSIMNEGGSDDTLISAETDVAEVVELHETTMDENDMMQMSPVENILIPAGGSATLEPGGKHVMLIGIQEGLAVGDTFDLTLNFEQSGSQTVQVEVTDGMAMDHDMDHDMEEGEMDHSDMEHEMEDGEMEGGEMDHDDMEHEMEDGDMEHEMDEESEGMSHEGHDDMAHGDKMMLKFAFKAGEADVVCGQEYADLGAEGTTAEISDARFYVSNIHLLNAAGEEVPFELEQDGIWQHMNIALLDFEDATGACSETGTAPVRNVVVGNAPEGDYTGLIFNLGVPFEMNHLDVIAAPSPLNIGAMWWNWQVGYKFARIDLLTNSPEAGSQWFIHLGSIGCESEASALPPETACAVPNLAEITLTDFDMMNDVIVADLAGLLEGVDISDSTPEPVGCMSGLDDPDCPSLISNFGLDQASGSCADGCVDQTFFQVSTVEAFETQMGDGASFEGMQDGDQPHNLGDGHGG